MSAEAVEGSDRIFHDAAVVDTCHYTYVKTHRLSAKYGLLG